MISYIVSKIMAKRVFEQPSAGRKRHRAGVLEESEIAAVA